jgi:hypothetical protein
MKIFMTTAAVLTGFVLGAVDVVPQVSDKGVMTLSCSGRTIIQSCGISAVNSKGEVVSEISKAQMKTFRNRNRIRNVWASDIFELQRLITTMPDGSVKVEWNGKFLQGNQQSSAIVVEWLTPILDSNFKAPDTLTLDDVVLKLNFAEGIKPQVKNVKRSRVDNEGSYITLEWKYDPAKVNDLSSALIVTVEDIKK